MQSDSYIARGTAWIQSIKWQRRNQTAVPLNLFKQISCKDAHEQFVWGHAEESSRHESIVPQRPLNSKDVNDHFVWGHAEDRYFNGNQPSMSEHEIGMRPVHECGLVWGSYKTYSERDQSSYSDLHCITQKMDGINSKLEHVDEFVGDSMEEPDDDAHLQMVITNTMNKMSAPIRNCGESLEDTGLTKVQTKSTLSNPHEFENPYSRWTNPTTGWSSFSPAVEPSDVHKILASNVCQQSSVIGAHSYQSDSENVLCDNNEKGSDQSINASQASDLCEKGEKRKTDNGGTSDFKPRKRKPGITSAPRRSARVCASQLKK